jgi:hypothetical protein
MDIISDINRSPKKEETKCPWEKFTGNQIDYLRDFRTEWGEPIIVKKPKGIASDLRQSGEWAIVVRRIMNGTGILKVYLVSTRRMAFRLKFHRAKPPIWILNLLNNISIDSKIGFEDQVDNPEQIIYEEVDKIQRIEAAHEEGALPMGPTTPILQEAQNNIAESVVADIHEEPDDNSDIDRSLNHAVEENQLPTYSDVHEPTEEFTNREREGMTTRANVEDKRKLLLEREADKYAEYVAMGWKKPDEVDDHLSKFSRKHPRSEVNLFRAMNDLRNSYLRRYGKDEITTESVNSLLQESTNILYEQARKQRHLT